MTKAFVGACVLLCAAGLYGAQYSNPVMAGDYPDPSVIRVGSEYWATATSSEWGPQFPILVSRDLVNWQVVGNVFSKRPEWSVANYWAPEIAEHKGRYYVYYVGRKKKRAARSGRRDRRKAIRTLHRSRRARGAARRVD